MKPTNFQPESAWRSTNVFFCPYCDYRHDAVTAADGNNRAPEDGSMSICFRCARASIFVINAFGQINLRKLTDEEITQVPDEAVTAAYIIQEHWKTEGGFPEKKP